VVRFVAEPNPEVRRVAFEGVHSVPVAELGQSVHPLLHAPWNPLAATRALENVLRVYRKKGYALARFDTTVFDDASGTLRAVVDEGVITSIEVMGGVRTQDDFVLSEFRMGPGEVFDIAKARRGIANVNSASLFEYVYLEVETGGRATRLTIRLKEKPSQLVRLGVRGDDERQIQGSIDIRDLNFRGAGTELGLLVAGGQRNTDIILEGVARRLFNTYLTFRVHGFYRTLDSYLYQDGPVNEPNRWSRVRTGEYRDVRYGAGVLFGTQLERLGTATIEFLLQNVRTKNLENAASLEERHQLGIVRLGTLVDTKDSYPFPRSGVGLNLAYEFSLETLGSDIGYNALSVMYESYSSWGASTFHPRFTVGFADRTMPFSQEFRLGGRDAFFGTREDDRRGRQLLLVNMEYRLHLPFRLLFDTYLGVRYDLGSIAAVPEEIKFSALRHGVGMQLSMDTPIGPAVFALGKSFFFSKDLPANPVQEGPFLFTFMIGYQW
jgi:NTE family protein